MRDVAGRRILVMGLGRFGGGVGVARWLAQHGAAVTVTDTSDREALRDSIAQMQPFIESGGVTLRLGAHAIEDFEAADMVVANPAVKMPWNDPFLRAAAAAGVPVTTEIRLVFEQLDRARIIGITGSAGKSTTAAMTHHLLNAMGRRAHLGGNFGGSLLSRIGRAVQPTDIIVLELSSAMLYWLGEAVGFEGAAGCSPRIALLTNLEPNHLDWHGGFEHYRESKLNIARWQDHTGRLIRGEDAPPLEESIVLSVPGAHNRRNAAMALAAAGAMIGEEIDVRSAAEALRTFKGLPHRLQLVGEYEGRAFYNDSKSTTPQATRLAVDAFDDPSRIHLIVGGSDKGADLAPIAALAERVAGLYCIGVTGSKIAAQASSSSPPSRRCEVTFCDTLQRAVERAVERMRPGEILLLSPGCASFDQFLNFEQRGERFMELVRRAMYAACT